jgi:hypothetical protein
MSGALKLDLTQNDVQVLNAIIAAAKNGVEAELQLNVPAPRAKFLKEARKVCAKWLQATGGSQPAARSTIITPGDPGWPA